MTERSKRLYRFGPYRLDVEECQLTRGTEPVSLSPKAFDTLVALVRHGGRLVGKDELIKEVWPETFVEESNLVHQISSLRKALGETEDGQPYVETVPRRGYRFAAPVTEEAEELPPAARRRLRWAVAAGGILALGTVIYLGRDRLNSTALAPDERVMLAVLPFDNLSGDPEQEYFSDGLTEEMITQLGQLSPERLGVIARTSSMQYKGNKKSVDQVGQELGVSYILEGSVRRSGGRVRVSAQLIQVSDQTHLWAQTYERDIEDILTIQAAVAEGITREIRIQLTAESHARMATTPPVDRTAHEAYLKGRYVFNRATSVQELQRSITYFDDALTHDPDFAPAHVGLADSHLRLGYYQRSTPELVSRIKSYAQRAIQLTGTRDEAHRILAEIALFVEWDWATAEAEVRRALKINPSSARARDVYTNLLLSRGQFARAIEERQASLKLGPLSHLLHCNGGWTYYISRKYEQAIELSRNNQEFFGFNCSGEYRVMGQSYAQLNMFSEAVRVLKECPRQNQPRVQAQLAYVLARWGREKEAREILGSLEKRERLPYFRAQIHTALGDCDAAFAALERAYDERSFWMAFINVEPRFDPLRGAPRFADLVNRMGLSDRSKGAPAT